MRKCLLLVVVICVCALPLIAQENAPRVEVFAGYQFSHIPGYNANGWNASSAFNFNNWLGVAADFSGAYKTVSGVDVRNHTFMFGPVVSYRKHETVTPFVHALFGADRLSASLSGVGSGATNGFAMAMGGGADVTLTRSFAVRVIQADWVYLRFSGVGESKNARVSTGIVLRF